MALVELNSNKVGSNAMSAVEEFKLHISTFRDRVQQQELETENAKRTCSLLMENMDIFQDTMKKFRYDTSYDVQDTKSKVENKMSNMKTAQHDLIQKTMKASRLCDDMSESVQTAEQTIALFGKQIERLEKEMEKVTKFGAKK